MRNVVIGLIIGVVVGVVVGVTILTPKIKSHAASKAVLNQRELSQAPTPSAPVVMPSLDDGDALHWRSAPPFPSDRPNVAAQAHSFAKRLSAVSGDKMILPVLPAKEVIPADKLFAALASGRIDALMSTADIAIDKEPALALFAAIPFGPEPKDVIDWLQAGSGNERLTELFSNHNIQPLVCGYLPPEAGGWFTKELISADQIKGLRIRADGMAARVWTKAGAAVQKMAPENIMAAFDQDKLDGAIFSTPAVDAKSGFNRFATNYYYPGWQNQGQPLLLLVNGRAWRKLDDTRRNLLKAACDQHTVKNLAQADSAQFDGLSQLSKQKVTLRRFPGYILSPLEEAWNNVLSEEARRNQTFRETWEDLTKFVKLRKTWREMSLVSQLSEDF